MLSKKDVVNRIITAIPALQTSGAAPNFGTGFAATNIALCKYWGKRNAELNLPITDSLSISLGHLGACTKISFADAVTDQVVLNHQVMTANTVFYRRLVQFLDLFRPTQDTVFNVVTKTNIPVAAGLASSACGFAALTKALCELFGLSLSLQQQSILARLGSGSACRSLWQGFVQWQAGTEPDGMDSHGVPLDYTWPELRIGLLLVDDREKPFSSREAMQTTVETSPFYTLWPKTLNHSLEITLEALRDKDFWSLGTAAEANALAMHALMMSSTPAIIYTQGATLEYMQQIWRARAEGLSIFFTQDAGANLKLLFLSKDESKVREMFNKIEIVAPFAPVEIPAECTSYA